MSATTRTTPTPHPCVACRASRYGADGQSPGNSTNPGGPLGRGASGYYTHSRAHVHFHHQTRLHGVIIHVTLQRRWGKKTKAKKYERCHKQEKINKGGENTAHHLVVDWRVVREVFAILGLPFGFLCFLLSIGFVPA
jgi:hypothetical protein